MRWFWWRTRVCAFRENRSTVDARKIWNHAELLSRRGYKFSSFINHWVERRSGMTWGGRDEMGRSWGQAEGQFKWRGKAEMRSVCRASIIRSAFIVSFGIGLLALPAAPIDNGDKCTHRARFYRGRRRTTLDDDRFSVRHLRGFISKTRINQRPW